MTEITRIYTTITSEEGAHQSNMDQHIIETSHSISQDLQDQALHQDLLEQSVVHLPAEGFTLLELNTWREAVISLLQQTPCYQIFLPAGIYSTWIPLQQSIDGLRIHCIHEGDTDKIELESSSSTTDKLDEGLKVLLHKRNSDLVDFIQIVCQLSNNSCTKQMTDESTSFESMVSLLEALILPEPERPRCSVLDIANIQMEAHDDYNSFYSKFRMRVCENLKKKGDRVNFYGDQELLEDELLSPTFEEIIVVWCLEKISPQLPKQVDKAYRDQLQGGDLTLMDLQEEIFQNIPDLLQSFDSEEQPKDNNEKASIKILKAGEITGFENIKFLDENGQIISGVESSAILSNLMPSTIIERTVDTVDQHSINTLQTEDINLNNFILKDESGNLMETFCCDICNKKYVTRRKLSDHMRIHKPKIFEECLCEKCNKVFETRKALTDHNWRHHKMDHTCQKCGLVFPTGKRLEVHAHSHNDYMCNVCSKIHTTYRELYHHQKSHLEKLKCDDCDKSFRKKSALEEHKLIHLSSELHPLYSCDLCEQMFDKRTALLQHNRTEHKQNNKSKIHRKTTQDGYLEIAPKPDSFSCNVCGKQFVTSNEMNEHRKVHLKTAVIICPICGRSQTSKHDLDDHMKSHNNEDLPQANNIITQQPVLTADSGVIVIQTGDTMIRVLPSVVANNEDMNDNNGCDNFSNAPGGLPNYIISDDGSLLQYNQVTSKQQELKSKLSMTKATFCCSYCDKLYHQEADFRYHLLSHGLGKKHECGLCEKYFILPKQLWTHRKIAHPAESKNLCVFCGETILDKIALTKHIRDHNPKNKTCDVCGKSFTNRYSLNIHMKSSHVDPNQLDDGEGDKKKRIRTIQCETCSRSFHNAEQMKGHVCKHHACDMCDEKFLKYKNLKCHKLIHSGETIYSCDQCEALFQNRRRLAEHKRNTHNAKRKYKCDSCPKAFIASRGLYNHKLTHSGEKPFSCTDCGASFRQKGALVSHYRLHTKECPFQCSGCDEGFRTLGLLKSHRERKMCGFTAQDLFQTFVDPIVES